MARIVFGMNQSLDGFVDHTAFAPSVELFQHFIDQARAQTGCLYGRGMYDVMRYWDEEESDWGPEEQAFARAWRAYPKWVFSRSLDSVGPNATLVRDDLEGVVRRVKEEHEGEIEVAGPTLAHALGDLGLVDEYRIYLHPVVVGEGKRYFQGPRPPLRLTSQELLADDVLRLTYEPA